MNLRRGTQITWNDNFGRGPPTTANIQNIFLAKELMENHYECEQVELVDSTWARLHKKEIILIMDNDKWLFGWQIGDTMEHIEEERTEICVSCNQCLPMKFVGTGWDYCEGQPMCYGCIAQRSEFLNEEQKKEMN